MAGVEYHVLILCTGNSARSIIGESLINRLGQGRFIGHSAGSTPTGKVNSFALRLLAQKNYPVEGLRSKSWDEFAGPHAPVIDFVFTVCDNAAGEVCPIWPGHPMVAHWGIPDPAAVEGTDEEKLRAFSDAYDRLEARIGAFLALPFDELDDDSLRSKLGDIGRL